MHSTLHPERWTIDAQAREHPFSAYLEVGWLILACLIPLWVNLWGQQPFDFAKAALLRTIVWLMVALWVAGLLPRTGLAPSIDLQRNLLRAALALALAWGVAAWEAYDVRLSLTGSYHRGQGFLTHLSYLLLFTIIATVLRRPDQAWRLAGAIVIPTAALTVLGLAQWLGFDPIGLTTDGRSPIYTTLGRANFTAAYCALALPITVALVVKHRATFQVWGWGILLVGQLVLIVLAQVRGAWAAAIVGLAVYTLWYGWQRAGQRGHAMRKTGFRRLDRPDAMRSHGYTCRTIHRHRGIVGCTRRNLAGSIRPHRKTAVVWLRL